MNVIPLFIDETTPLVGRLPVAPLVPFILRAEREVGGLTELGRRIADRCGGNAVHRERMLQRIVHCDQCTITARVADELAVALGLHPSLIWPDEWFRFSHEEAV